MNFIDDKYISIMSRYLLVFKQTGESTYNFRCPFCKDSTKSKSKARGYLFGIDGGYIYKCHNCGIPKNLYSLLKEVNYSLYDEYKREKIKEKFSHHKKEKKTVVDKNIFKTNVDFSHVNTLGYKLLSELRKVSDVEDARNYCKNRQIPESRYEYLYYTNNGKLIGNMIPKYKDKKFPDTRAIVIPFINESGIVTHIQLRYIDDTYMRYVTLEVEENPDRKIYGMDLIDKKEMVYVFEGSFDAMFTNGIALANGNLHTFIPILNKLFDNYAMVYDKDYLYNRDILSSLKKSMASGVNVVLYDDMVIDSKSKDINDLVVNKVIDNVSHYLRKNTYQGFTAKIKLDKALIKHRHP